MTLISQKAQATLELSVALILVLMLIVASVEIFVWLNARMIKRQIDFQGSRETAASATPETVTIGNLPNATSDQLNLNEVGLDESGYPELNIVEKLGKI